MIILAFAVLGILLGITTARKRKGNRLDMAQYAAGYAIAFMLLGVVASIVIERIVGLMFLPFFDALRRAGVPVTLREYLGFLGALDAGLATYDVDAFYYLGRTIMVKNEAHLDRFDRAFAESFKGIEAIPIEAVFDALDLPEEWLRKMAEKHLSAEEKAEIEALGGFDKLMETLRERLKRTRRSPSGRVEMDRHGRHVALRGLWLQPRRRSHRARCVAPPTRRQSLGQARLQRPRRYPRDRHTHDQGGAATTAPMGPRRGA